MISIYIQHSDDSTSGMISIYIQHSDDPTSGMISIYIQHSYDLTSGTISIYMQHSDDSTSGMTGVEDISQAKHNVSWRFYSKPMNCLSFYLIFIVDYYIF